MNLCGIFYNVFDYLQNWLNLENLFISVALALGKMLRCSSVFVVFFFFPFSAQNKTKPKESRVLLLPLLPVGSDFLRHRCHQEKDDFLITQAFFALSSFILYQKQTALAGECIGLVCWAQCLTAERPLVWQVFLLTEAFPAVKILVIPFPSVKQ